MNYQDRDYRRTAVDFDEHRHVPARSPAPPSRRGREEFDIDVRVRERERESDGLGFLGRRQEAGPMVLRPREVSPIDHHGRDRERSPPGMRYHRDDRSVRRGKSMSPPEHEHERTRIIERERERDTFRSPSVARHRSPSTHRRRSPSTHRRRSPSAHRRSPSPNRNVRYFDAGESEHVHAHIIERQRERSPSPAPSAPVIRGPVIEREVITHYTDVDHGVVSARTRSPAASIRRRERDQDIRETRETRDIRDSRDFRETRETDIDISLSKGRAEVDIHRSASRTRSKSRDRRSRFIDDELVVRRDLKVEENLSRRRAHSVGAQEEDSEYITSRLDARGHMGEAHGGATKGWTIVDVPPGTERIRMDGVGGGATDTTFSKYSGVRRTTFIPDRDRDRDREGSVVDGPASVSGRKDHRLNISVYDRERDIEIDKVGDRRMARSPAPPPPKEMWTEITKDLVVREAIEEMGYEYEETEYFFYIMEYLRYDDVLHLTDLSDEIRRSKRSRAHDRYDQRDYYDDVDRKYYEAPAGGRRQPQPSYRRDEGTHERIRETEVIYDSRPGRSYR